MNNTPGKQGKRVVSISEYAKVQAKVNALRLASVGLYIPIYLCNVFFLGSLLWIIAGGLAYIFNHAATDSMQLLRTFQVLLISCIGAYACQTSRTGLMQKAKRMDDCVYLSPVHPDLLPVSDSLVRASEEPAQAQQAVLLRPSIETQEQREEQLLRASAGE